MEVIKSQMPGGRRAASRRQREVESNQSSSDSPQDMSNSGSHVEPNISIQNGHSKIVAKSDDLTAQSNSQLPSSEDLLLDDNTSNGLAPSSGDGIQMSEDQSNQDSENANSCNSEIAPESSTLKIPPHSQALSDQCTSVTSKKSATSMGTNLSMKARVAGVFLRSGTNRKIKEPSTEDILDSLEPDLKSEASENENLVDEKRDAKKELEEVRKKVRDLESKLEKTEEELEKTKEIANRIDDAEKENRKLKEDIQGADTKRSEQKRLAENAEAENEELVGEVLKAKNKIKKVENESSLLKNQLEDVQNHMTTLKNEEIQAKKEISKLQQSLSLAEESSGHKDKVIEDLARNKAKLETSRVEAIEEAELLKQEVETLRRAAEKFTRDAEKENSRLKLELAQLEKEKEKHILANAKQKDKMRELDQLLSDQAASLADAEDEKRQLGYKLKEVQWENEELEQAKLEAEDKVRRLQEDNEAKSEVLNLAELERSKLKTESDVKLKEIDCLRGEVTKLDCSKQDILAQYRELEVAIDDFKVTIRDRQDNIETLKKRIKDLEKKLNQEKAERLNVEEQNDKLSVQVTELEKLLKELRPKLADLEDLVQNKDELLENLQTKLQAERQRKGAVLETLRKDLETTKEEAENFKVESTSQIERLKQELRAKHRECEDRNVELSDALSASTRLREQQGLLKDQLKTSQLEAEACSCQLEEAQDNLERQMKEMLTLKKNVSEMETERSGLVESCEVSERELKGAREKLRRLEHLVKMADEEKTDLEGELLKLQQQRVDIEKVSRSKDEHIRDWKSQVEKLEADLENVRSTLSAVNAQAKENSQKSENAFDEYSKLELQLNRLIHEKDLVEQSFEAEKERGRKRDQEIAEKDKEIQTLKAVSRELEVQARAASEELLKLTSDGRSMSHSELCEQVGCSNRVVEEVKEMLEREIEGLREENRALILQAAENQACVERSERSLSMRLAEERNLIQSQTDNQIESLKAQLQKSEIEMSIALKELHEFRQGRDMQIQAVEAQLAMEKEAKRKVDERNMRLLNMLSEEKDKLSTLKLEKWHMMKTAEQSAKQSDVSSQQKTTPHRKAAMDYESTGKC